MKRNQENKPQEAYKIRSYRFLALATLLFFIVPLNGCKKLLDVNPSTTQILSSTVFTDSLTTQSAIVGMYNALAPQGQKATPYRFTLSSLPGFSADEMQFIGSTYDTYINNTLLSSDADVALIWSVSYAAIYNANSIIQGVAASSNISENFKKQATAEAMFIRAFSYFYLTNLFGDVPLVLTTDVNQNASLPRTAGSTIYAQIISDLKFAQANLRSDYSISPNSRIRVNSWAATAMLARVYLYTGDWANAEAQATSVINNTTLFDLPKDLTKVFAPSSTEAIFQIANDSQGYTWYATNVTPNSVSHIPTYVMTPDLVSQFEAGDARKATWTGTTVYNGVTYTYPYKYKNITTSANAEYYTVLRLAEQYLIRAEARANQANINGAVADINTIRARARVTSTDLPDYPTTISQSDCMADIAKERRIELNCEWGHRWFDLKRTGALNTVLAAAKPNFWKPAAALYPIPTGQITVNGNLTQNPGYN